MQYQDPCRRIWRVPSQVRLYGRPNGVAQIPRRCGDATEEPRHVAVTKPRRLVSVLHGFRERSIQVSCESRG